MSKKFQADKMDLYARLQVLRNSFFLGWAACYVLSQTESHPFLKGSSMGFEQWIDELADEKQRTIYLFELQKHLARSMLKEPFELIKDYCNTTNQLKLMQNQVWFQYARMIRNNISHNMRFNFNDYDKSKLPVSWNGTTIDISMDGKFLDIRLMGPQDITTLIDEMISFVDVNLS